MHSLFVGRHTLRIHRTALTAAAALALACNDSTAPIAEFDADVVNETAQTFAGSLGDNQVLQILEVMGSRMALQAAGARLVLATTPFAPETEAGRSWIGRRAGRLADASLTLGAADPAVLIPGDLLGKTLVYNPATEGYEIDEDLAGAPTDGVRFILYAVDPIQHQVLSPLQEIGFLDLVDESTPAADRLGITASVGNVVLLDYEAAASIGVVGGVKLTFTAAGSVGDQDDRLDFDLSQELSEASGLELDYLIGRNEGANVRLQVSAASQESVSLSLTIEDVNGRVILAVTGSDDILEGTVRFNGEVVVQITGTPDEPVFTDPAGNPLDDRARRALRELFGFADALVTLFDHLLRPAHNILSVPVLAL